MNAIRGAFSIAKRYAQGGSDGDSYDPALDPTEDEAKAFADRAPVTVTPPPSAADRARAAAAQLSAARHGTPPSPIPANAPPGEQSLTEYHPTVKEHLLNTLSDSLAGNSLSKQNFVEGIGHVMDWTPGIGQALQAQEGIQRGDYQTAAAAFMPGAAEGFGGAKTAAAKAAFDLAPDVFKQAYKTHAGTGSNPGGFFSGFPDGIDRYVKTMDEAHARNEVLANRFYEMWGVPVAHNELTMTPGGKYAVASHIIPDSEHLGVHQETAPGEAISGLHEHFPADAMLANWDVVGLNRDNVLVDPSSQAWRIDHGGALDYRAKGAPKGKAFGNEVGELDTMRKQGEAGEIFKDVTLDPGNQTAQKIAATTDDQIHALVKQYGGSTELAEKLIARRDDLAGKYGIISHDAERNLEAEWAKANPPGTTNFGLQSPQLTAQQIIGNHTDNAGIDPEGVAAEMYNIAKGGHPSYVDEVYKALPEDIQAEVNHHLTDIIREAGIDPWSIHEPEAEVTLLPKELPKSAETPEAEKPKNQTPLKLMQLNKTHSSGELVNAVAKTSWDDAKKNPKLVTPKQVAKIVAMMNNASPSGLGASMADLSYTQQKAALSWISDHKQLKNVKSTIDGIKDQSYTAADLAEYEELKHQHELYDYEMAQGIEKKEQESTFGKKAPVKMPTGGKYIGGSFIPQHVFDAIKPMDYLQYKVKNGKYLGQEDFPNTNIGNVKNQKYGLLQLWHGQKKGTEPGGYFNSWLDPMQFQGYTYHDEAAIFLSHDPYIAKSYGKGAVLPYIARADGKIGIVHYPEAKFSELDKQQKDYSGYSSTTMSRLTKAGRQMGYDMLVVKGISDIGGPQTQYLVLNPSILRAPTAKFDPAKKKLMESLSGIAGIPAAGAATYGITQQGQPQQQARGGKVRDYTMPLKPGASKAVVSQNIREFHTGPTYSHTAAKFGKAKANKQAIAVALSTARKYKAGGGEVQKMALGGPDLSMENMVMRGSMYGLRREGMINSPIPGRTDKIGMNVKAGSYVLPADIPSALGQGNTMAGGAILKKMFSSGPYGLGGMGKPGRVSPPHMNFVKPPSMGGMGKKMPFAKGGTNSEQSGESEPGVDESVDHVPIIAAGGEFIIDPAVVRDIGHGNIKAGHRVLDRFVLDVRKKHIDTLKKLKPPKK